MIDEIFKIPLYNTTLSLDTKSIRSYCLSLSKKSKGRVVLNEGGWQSENLPISDIPSLCDGILTEAILFALRLEMVNTLAIDNIWANINGYKDYNLPHKHPNTIYSGVYYVKVPKNSGLLTLVHPAADSMQYDWNNTTIKKRNLYNSENWSLRAEVGRLYIFPGWLTHFVRANQSKEKRISFSFNIKVI